MIVTATLKLSIDIAQAEEMGYEIENPEEYAREEFIEWVYEMMKSSDLEECIYTEIQEEI